MSESDQLVQKLESTFVAELDDRVRTLNDLLLRLERAGEEDATSLEIVHRLFREAHSLKGAAKAVEAQAIERIAGDLEIALDEVRRLGGQAGQAWFDRAYRAVDALVPLGAEFALGATIPAPNQTPADAPAASESRITVRPAGSNTSHDERNESVRVAVGKLDSLLAQTGELTVTTMHVEERLRQIGDVREELDKWRRQFMARRETWAALRRPRENQDHSGEDARAVTAVLRFLEQSDRFTRAMQQQIDDLYRQLRTDAAELRLVNQALGDQVLSARLLPVSTMFTPFQRMVRDLAREQGKMLRLELNGGEVEVDRRILEELRDPVMHMLRNAVDHGIESPRQREAAGKPPIGTLTLTAAQRSGSVEIVLEDDGAGVDFERLRRAAVRAGVLSAEQAESLDDEAAAELLYQPGISTTQVANPTSGRGVGMDVVREHIRRLGGTVTFTSTLGQGTRFLLAAPMSLATTRALLVEQANGLVAIPSAMVDQAARVRSSALRSIEGRQTVAHQGRPLPAVELSAVLEQPQTGDVQEWRTYLVLRQDERRVALLTGALRGEQEIVVKPLGWPLQRVRNVTGAAVLGSGQVAIVLNPADLVKSAVRLSSVPPSQPSRPARRRSRVLVVDDSQTTRMLEQSILEAAGYETVAAADGEEALALLHAEAVDLVVSDVEMPRLDGFALTGEIRRREELRQIPVVLLTSMDQEDHRVRGMQAGADAYLVKSNFEQAQLLETVGRLL